MSLAGRWDLQDYLLYLPVQSYLLSCSQSSPRFRAPCCYFHALPFHFRYNRWLTTGHDCENCFQDFHFLWILAAVAGWSCQLVAPVWRVEKGSDEGQ